MAYDKPHRHIEARPKAVSADGHEGCTHSLADHKKLTKIPFHYLREMFRFSRFPEIIETKIKRLKKLKKLIRRRKVRNK